MVEEYLHGVNDKTGGDKGNGKKKVFSTFSRKVVFMNIKRVMMIIFFLLSLQIYKVVSKNNFEKKKIQNLGEFIYIENKKNLLNLKTGIIIYEGKYIVEEKIKQICIQKLDKEYNVKEQKCILTKNLLDYTVDNDFLYYVEYGNEINRLIQYNISTSESKELIEILDGLLHFHVQNGYIYYSKYGMLYELTVDKLVNTKLFEGKYVFDVQEKWIYFFSEKNNCLSKQKIGQTRSKCLYKVKNKIGKPHKISKDLYLIPIYKKNSFTYNIFKIGNIEVFKRKTSPYFYEIANYKVVNLKD